MVKENKPEKVAETGERDESGKFVEGHKGIGGRPKGVSITAKIKEKLLEVPEGQEITYLDALIKKIFKKAIADEDPQMIKQLWNYIDGMPPQPIEHSGGLEQRIDLSEKTKKEISKFIEMEKKQI